VNFRGLRGEAASRTAGNLIRRRGGSILGKDAQTVGIPCLRDRRGPLIPPASFGIRGAGGGSPANRFEAGPRYSSSSIRGIRLGTERARELSNVREGRAGSRFVGSSSSGRTYGPRRASKGRAPVVAADQLVGASRSGRASRARRRSTRRPLHLRRELDARCAPSGFMREALLLDAIGGGRPDRGMAWGAGKIRGESPSWRRRRTRRRKPIHQIRPDRPENRVLYVW